jgi:hypothetical protein
MSEVKISTALRNSAIRRREKMLAEWEAKGGEHPALDLAVVAAWDLFAEHFVSLPFVMWEDQPPEVENVWRAVVKRAIKEYQVALRGVADGGVLSHYE